MVGASCLGLASARRRPATAGLVLGLAGTMKLTAWPALLVGLVLVTGHGGRHGGLRRYAFTAAAVLAIGVLLSAVIDPSGLVTNVVLYPLGLTAATSPAASPLPGHLGSSPEGATIRGWTG